jgi:hypothetical protein
MTTTTPPALVSAYSDAWGDLVQEMIRASNISSGCSRSKQKPLRQQIRLARAEFVESSKRDLLAVDARRLDRLCFQVEEEVLFEHLEGEAFRMPRSLEGKVPHPQGTERFHKIATVFGFFVPFFIFIAVFAAAARGAERLETVTIKSCYDGDTCTTSSGERIRLACIDTPELRGKNADPVPAKAARDYLNGLVRGQQVRLRRINIDRYGRTVGELYSGGVNLQQALVRNGHARIYWKYAHQCSWAK